MNHIFLAPPIRIRIQSGCRVYDQKFKKTFLAKMKIFLFLDKKLHFTYPYVSLNDVQVTKEAFSFQKRTSSTSKHEIS
jgi:hypothetical protein